MNKEFWNLIDRLIKDSTIVIDRPKGNVHPRYHHCIYPLDYGYLADTSSMDGGGIDLWMGSLDHQYVDAIICTIDLIKRDSEIKLLLGCTKEEKNTVLAFHNDSEYMKAILISREER